MDIRENWINLLHRAATGTKKTRTLLTPIGITIFGGPVIAIRRRIELIRSLFLDLGFEGQELETRILAFIGYMSMVHSSEDPEVRREHLKHLEERHAVLTGA